jgi:glucuronate isomerase
VADYIDMVAMADYTNMVLFQKIQAWLRVVECAFLEKMDEEKTIPDGKTAELKHV